MPLSTVDLQEVRRMAMDYGNCFLRSRNLEDRASLFVIVLYGSAAACHLDRKDRYNDFDVNVFFQSEVALGRGASTRGKPKIIGQHDGKKVEVMRNVYRGRVVDRISAIKGYARRMQSKRWIRIRSEPVVFSIQTS